MTTEKPLEGAVWKARTERERPAIPRSHVVSLVYRVPESRRGQFLAYLGGAFPFYQRPGGIRVGLYESLDEPGLFLELIAYSTEEDYVADQARVESAPDYQEVLGGWRVQLDGPPDVLRMRSVSVERRGVSLAPATLQAIDVVWRRRWGLPVYTPGHQYQPQDVEGLMAVSAEGATLGLVTWAVHGTEAEIVSLDALETGQGHGSRLLQAAEEALRGRGVSLARYVTSNDNLNALDFVQRRGYRLVRINLDGMEEVRRIKPGVPEVGTGGVPLRDIWVLEKQLEGVR